MEMKDVVKPNPTLTMSDDVWETYEILTGLCKSLNALLGTYRRQPQIISAQLSYSTAIALEKAQKVITILLEETGRMKEYEEWESRRK